MDHFYLHYPAINASIHKPERRANPRQDEGVQFPAQSVSFTRQDGDNYRAFCSFHDILEHNVPCELLGLSYCNNCSISLMDFMSDSEKIQNILHLYIYN